MSKIRNIFQLKNSFFTSPLEGKQLYVFFAFEKGKYHMGIYARKPIFRDL